MWIEAEGKAFNVLNANWIQRIPSGTGLHLWFTGRNHAVDVAGAQAEKIIAMLAKDGVELPAHPRASTRSSPGRR